MVLWASIYFSLPGSLLTLSDQTLLFQADVEVSHFSSEHSSIVQHPCVRLRAPLLLRFFLYAWCLSGFLHVQCCFLSLTYAFVLVRVSIVSVKHMTKKQVGEEKVYSTYTSTLMFITKGSQDRNSHRAGIWRQELMQRPMRGAAYWIALHGVCSAFFLTEPNPTNPGVAPSTMDWSLPHPSLVERMPYNWIL